MKKQIGLLGLIWIGAAIIAAPSLAQQFVKPGAAPGSSVTPSQPFPVVTQPVGKFGALQNVIVTETRQNGITTRRSCQVLNLPGGQQSVTCR